MSVFYSSFYRLSLPSRDVSTGCTHVGPYEPPARLCSRSQRGAHRVVARRESAAPVAPPHQADVQYSPRSRRSAAPLDRHRVCLSCDRLSATRYRRPPPPPVRRASRARAPCEREHVASRVLDDCGAHAPARRRVRCLVASRCAMRWRQNKTPLSATLRASCSLPPHKQLLEARAMLHIRF